MDLQEDVNRIKEMMGLLNEQEDHQNVFDKIGKLYDKFYTSDFEVIEGNYPSFGHFPLFVTLISKPKNNNPYKTICKYHTAWAITHSGLKFSDGNSAYNEGGLFTKVKLQSEFDKWCHNKIKEYVRTNLSEYERKY